jgi:hypothetical protein
MPDPRDPHGQIIRHQQAADFELATGDEATIAAVEDHIERYVGKPANVFHELISDKVHLDVHIVEPTTKRPWHTLVTSGMSDRPMTVPDDSTSPRFAELCVLLPEDWKLTEKAFKREENYWPVRWLKQVARLPHDYRTWVGPGHTVPNGDPPQPFADDTELCCLLVARPMNFARGFRRLRTEDGKEVAFYVLLPLHAAEVRYKLKHGADALTDKFDAVGLDDVIDPGRRSVVGKR